MAAITNGAELVRKLRESGTGESKLAVCAAKLDEVYAARREVARSEEIVSALEQTFPGSVTAEKARQFAATGFYEPAAKAPVVNAEDRFLGPAPVPKDEVREVVGPMKVHQYEAGNLESKALAEEKAKLEADKARFAEERAKHEAEVKALAEEKAKLEVDAKAKAEDDAKKAGDTAKGGKTGK